MENCRLEWSGTIATFCSFNNCSNFGKISAPNDLYIGEWKTFKCRFKDFKICSTEVAMWMHMNNNVWWRVKRESLPAFLVWPIVCGQYHMFLLQSLWSASVQLFYCVVEMIDGKAPRTWMEASLPRSCTIRLRKWNFSVFSAWVQWCTNSFQT